MICTHKSLSGFCLKSQAVLRRFRNGIYPNVVPVAGAATGLQVGVLPILSAASHGPIDLSEASEVLSLHGEDLVMDQRQGGRMRTMVEGASGEPPGGSGNTIS
jgi:hypothetical protein